MSNEKSRRRIMSVANVVQLLVFLGVGIVSVVLGRWLGAVVFGLLFVLQFATVLYVRRRSGVGDVTRVNALEYSDERDKAIALHGLAAVGVAALAGTFALFVWAILTVDPGSPTYVASALSFGGLSAVWAAANSVAARRL